MAALRKITVRLPADLIDDCMRLSGKGLTETVRDALEAYVQRATSPELGGGYGQIKLGAPDQPVQ
ncbi:MAG: hypothetical protein ACXW3D_00580 [Caulobacteraceae bacterium]